MHLIAKYFHLIFSLGTWLDQVAKFGVHLITEKLWYYFNTISWFLKKPLWTAQGIYGNR